ncbi:capsid vertex protein [uncultured Caudovirales phage]|uniref:Capsid vertex protein n=1 Tax=uncultured Caudovirales phage TaxID=2100421 RepID=A0A6J5T0K1_9CAUD|nr:capsid vertex protein [uncultured Caudovirales phage]
MTQELLEGRWGETKDALLEGLQGSRRTTMSIILENTRRNLAETASTGATTSGNMSTLNRVILPVIRRVMPTVIANEIVGVQPMTGPVAQIHTLRVRYADNVSAGNDGASVGDEALSPFKIATAYSGNPATSRAYSTSALEGVPGNRINVQILKQVVEARTRKLSARWTFEAAQDAQAMHGLDVEAEIMAALAQEITVEIDQEVLASLRSLAATEFYYNQAAVSGTATFVGDEHAALAVLINRAANSIAQRTRRGAANWAVVSSAALTVLQSATTSAFARTTEGTFEAPTNTKFVGTLNGAMRIFVDSYADDQKPVLVGYKGSSEADAAAFYCPYVPLMSSGVVLDPATFEPVVGFMTRYGYVELTNTASSLGNAGDYVSEIAVQNLSFQ